MVLAKAGPFSAAGDGSDCKAVLIHGAPGIGKTTCAELCCRELKLAYRETNASEARNKKSIADIRSSAEDIGHFVRKNFGYINEQDLRGGRLLYFFLGYPSYHSLHFQMGVESMESDTC